MLHAANNSYSSGCSDLSRSIILELSLHPYLPNQHGFYDAPKSAIQEKE
jgi:hypothetical protein